MADSAIQIFESRTIAKADVPTNTGFYRCGFEYHTRPISHLTVDKFQLSLPASLGNASPKRQAEFLAGRYCAFRACEALNIHLEKLPIGSDGVPIWPGAIVGSISHTKGIAACLVGSISRFHGLGLDLEWLISDCFIDALSGHVVTEDEKDRLEWLGDVRLALTLVFSAKESIYKAIQPSVGRYVDFKEVQCESVRSDRLNFKIEGWLKEELGGLSGLEVSFDHSGGLVTTWCRWRRN